MHGTPVLSFFLFYWVFSSFFRVFVDHDRLSPNYLWYGRNGCDILSWFRRRGLRIDMIYVASRAIQPSVYSGLPLLSAVRALMAGLGRLTARHPPPACTSKKPKC